MKEYCWRIHQGDKKAAYRELQSRHPSPNPKTEAEKLQEAIYRELQSHYPPQGRAKNGDASTDGI